MADAISADGDSPAVGPAAPSLPTAVVLCGGLGTRLRGLHPSLPKALAPVAGRPFLAWQLDWLRSQGVRRIVLASGYRAEQIEAWLAEPRDRYPELEIKLEPEPEPLGTAGALVRLLPKLGDTFFALNGDTLLPGLDLGRLATGSMAPAVLAAVEAPNEGSPSCIELSAEGLVSRFHPPDSAPASTSRPRLVNGGVYLLSKTELDLFPKARSLEQEVLPKLAAQGRLGAVVTPPPLLDMGTPEGTAAMTAYLTRESRSILQPGP